MKEQIIDKLDFSEEEYERVRTPIMLPFGEMVDNAIEQFKKIDADGWKHGDPVKEIVFELNDTWSLMSKD